MDLSQEEPEKFFCPTNDYIHFELDGDGHHFSVILNAHLFDACAERQAVMVERYLWDENSCLYYDFDCSTMVRSVYKTCTSIWPMWANLCTKERAEQLVPAFLKAFLVRGGIVAGTEESRGHISLIRPNRQWDFPYGWAPHQLLAWKALENYGFHLVAEELVYRWLFCITKSFVEYNGVVPEKFDVVNVSHLVSVEYGNVGVGMCNCLTIRFQDGREGGIRLDEQQFSGIPTSLITDWTTDA